MHIPTKWINAHLDQELSTDEIVKSLEAAGVEVEDVIRPVKLDPNIVVAKILEIQQHPNADRLRLAKVDDGSSDLLDIVCGAPNIEIGQHVPLARVGAELHDGMQIKEAEIRGQKSCGMLCSERELGLSDDHSGILILDDEPTPGTQLSTILGSGDSEVLDLKTAANRPDLQSVVGLAREVVAHSEANLAFDDGLQAVAWPPDDEELSLLSVKDAALSPRYMAAKLTFSKPPAETPDWMARRLTLSGVRPISPIVDVTNYIMLEVGQPLHAFDASKVTGKLQVRQAQDGEQLTTLDGVSRSLSSLDIVIADDNGPVGLAGVMGGANSEVDENSTEILLEAANFDGSRIRRSAVRHGIRTEASARFERGPALQLVQIGLDRAIHIYNELFGARLVLREDRLSAWPWVQYIGVRSDKISTLAGIEVSGEQTVDSLRALGFEAREFDVADEARRLIGTPYELGASFKTHGTDAFDCSYLADYVYSLIDTFVGHTALAQHELGSSVEMNQLKPGDLLFCEGLIEQSATDHYFVKAEHGQHERINLDQPLRVGHVGIYIGDDRVVAATKYEKDGDSYRELEVPGVVELPLSDFTEREDYLGARRYLDDLEGYITVTVPYWRGDVRTPEDVFEEVMKMVGLDEIPATIPSWSPLGVPAPQTEYLHWWQLRERLATLGLVEATTYPFISEKDLERFNLDHEPHLRLQNPRSPEQAYLRRNLAPTLVKALANNTHQQDNVAFFEKARVFIPRDGEALPDEPDQLSVVAQHKDNAYSWVKQALDTITRTSGVQLKPLSGHAVDYLHPSRQLAFGVGDGKPLAIIGELHPDIARSYKLKNAAAALTVNWPRLVGQWTHVPFKPYSVFPAVERDITLELPAHVRWHNIREALEDEQTSLEFIDDYRTGAGRKLTFRVAMSDFAKTLTEQDVTERMKQLAAVLKKEFDVSISK